MRSGPNVIDMYKRDSKTVEVTVLQDSGAPQNLTGASIFFTVKAKATDKDNAAIIKKKNQTAGGSDSEIKITDAPAGIFEVYIVPADTTNCSSGTYIYDVQVTLPNGENYTVLRDHLIIKDDVTHGT